MDDTLLIFLPVTTFKCSIRKEITMKDHMENSRKGHNSAYLIDRDLSQHLIFFWEIIHIYKG